MTNFKACSFFAKTKLGLPEKYLSFASKFPSFQESMDETKYDYPNEKET